VTEGMVHGRTLKSSVTGKCVFPALPPTSCLFAQSPRLCRYLKRYEVRDAASARPVEIATGVAGAVGYEKMSKSKYNGVDPDDMVATWALILPGCSFCSRRRLTRCCSGMKMQERGSTGGSKRLWQVCHSVSAPPAAQIHLMPPLPPTTLAELASTNARITAVTQDMEQRRFNSAIAELMKRTNSLIDASSSCSFSCPCLCARTLLQMLAPLAPHAACELWECGREGQGAVLETPWPVAGEERAQTEVVAVASWRQAPRHAASAGMYACRPRAAQASGSAVPSCRQVPHPIAIFTTNCAVVNPFAFCFRYHLASAVRVVVAKSGYDHNFLAVMRLPRVFVGC